MGHRGSVGKASIKADAVIAPGATIGIVGGGQLGRMIATAAAELGYRCAVLTPEGNRAPASQVCEEKLFADYRDAAALDALAEICAVVTYEFENVPEETVAYLEGRVPVRPGALALKTAQNRLAEKTFATDCGLATAAFAPVASAADLAVRVKQIGLPAVLKTTSLGYDGKGQLVLTAAAPFDADDAWAKLIQSAPGSGVERERAANAGPPAILEAFVNFSCEISVIVARGMDGRMVSYPAALNQHEGGILRRSTVPAPLSPLLLAKAENAARLMAEKLAVVGLLAVEMFVTHEGEILINEIAPRPHNSGHWTQDACRTSQFSQLVRAICGLPLGAVDRHADVVMENLIGDDVARYATLLSEPDVCLHLYGKADARPGRKMGHVNRLAPRERLSTARLGDIDPHLPLP